MIRLFRDGLRIGDVSLIHPVCPGCGDRLTKVSGWDKFECPNGCDRSIWRDKIHVEMCRGAADSKPSLLKQYVYRPVIQVLVLILFVGGALRFAGKDLIEYLKTPSSQDKEATTYD